MQASCKTKVQARHEMNTPVRHKMNVRVRTETEGFAVEMQNGLAAAREAQLAKADRIDSVIKLCFNLRCVFISAPMISQARAQSRYAEQ